MVTHALKYFRGLSTTSVFKKKLHRFHYAFRSSVAGIKCLFWKSPQERFPSYNPVSRRPDTSYKQQIYVSTILVACRIGFTVIRLLMLSQNHFRQVDKAQMKTTQRRKIAVAATSAAMAAAINLMADYENSTNPSVANCTKYCSATVTTGTVSWCCSLTTDTCGTASRPLFSSAWNGSCTTGGTSHSGPATPGA